MAEPKRKRGRPRKNTTDKQFNDVELKFVRDNLEMDPEVMASMLNRTAKECVAKISELNEGARPQRDNMQDFVTNTVGGSKGVTIMTGPASERADDFSSRDRRPRYEPRGKTTNRAQAKFFGSLHQVRKNNG